MPDTINTANLLSENISKVQGDYMRQMKGFGIQGKQDAGENSIAAARLQSGLRNSARDASADIKNMALGV